jgi:small GTP-binding protein
MDEPIPVKVVLVGDTGVGKTCIIQRYVNNSYSEENESTLSSTYTNKVLEFKEYNKKLSLDIWDTAGQELYRALAKNFYLNAAIGILVYDIRRRESYDSIKNYWVEQMRESGEENMILGIAGNKCDLFQEEEVPDDEVKKFAQSIGAIFKPTSCKECIGIDELFQECGKKFLESNKYIEINKKEKVKEKDKPIKLENKKIDKNNDNNKKKCC